MWFNHVIPGHVISGNVISGHVISRHVIWSSAFWPCDLIMWFLAVILSCDFWSCDFRLCDSIMWFLSVIWICDFWSCDWNMQFLVMWFPAMWFDHAISGHVIWTCDFWPCDFWSFDSVMWFLAMWFPAMWFGHLISGHVIWSCDFWSCDSTVTDVGSNHMASGFSFFLSILGMSERSSRNHNASRKNRELWNLAAGVKAESDRMYCNYSELQATTYWTVGTFDKNKRNVQKEVAARNLFIFKYISITCLHSPTLSSQYY